MAGGRPTKYENEVTLKKTEEYILNGFLQAGDVIPTKEGLSEYLGVACSTIELWAEKHEEFSGSFRALVKKQSRILQNMGLLGTFNPTITKLLLSANHGMNEKTEVEKSGSVDSNLKIEFVDK